MADSTGAHVGRRLREIRTWRGLSLRATAELAGLSESHLSRIERGERPVDKRSTLEALAGALQVAPSELTGQPYPPVDAHDAEARATIADLELALTAPALGDPWDQPHPATDEPWPRLAEQLQRLNTVHRPAADYTAQGKMLPGLLAGLHGALVHQPAHRREVLHGLLHAYHAAEELANSLGVRGLPQLATVHARSVAEELDEPPALALAAWLRVIVSGSAGRERTLAMCAHVIDNLTPALADPASAQMSGALHLTSALACATLQRADDTASYLDEAQRIAHTIPVDAADAGLVYFGINNVGIWRVSIAVELGEGGRVAEIARTVNPDAVPSSARRAMFYADLGRGLATERSTHEQAVAALRQAEDSAPQLIRSNFYVRETVTDLLRRANRGAGGRELRGMAYRMGLAG